MIGVEGRPTWWMGGFEGVGWRRMVERGVEVERRWADGMSLWKRNGVEENVESQPQ